jgi:hypothetical protein
MRDMTERKQSEIDQARPGSQGRRLPIQEAKRRDDVRIEQVHLVEIHRPHEGAFQARWLEIDVVAARISEAISDGASARN